MRRGRGHSARGHRGRTELWATAKTSVFILREEGSALHFEGTQRPKSHAWGCPVCEEAIRRKPGCGGPAPVGWGEAVTPSGR